MTINRGGPAFPRSGTPILNETKQWPETSNNGMTLRQWYAGLAMQGLCANSAQDYGHADAAAYAFNLADAMLAHEEAEAKKLEGEPA